jgi:oxygen-independent coproporphyrinogen-3 oxidase
MTALYVHIPFCPSRCVYCGFNTYAGLDHLIPAYVDALCTEIQTTPRVQGHTLFFGGGTPSTLPLDLLRQLVDMLRARFDLPDWAEVSLEGNPGTINRSYAKGLRAIGINRLSLGAQSSHESELLLLGRAHLWTDCLEAVKVAQDAGLENINLDLIYGLPGQKSALWRETLEKAIKLELPHLSLYALKVEPGTPLEKTITLGDLEPPNEDIAAEMYEFAEARLAEAGYFHYEISNWARVPSGNLQVENSTWWPRHYISGETGPNYSEDISPFVSRHNLAYWRNEAYLGFGAGASSWMNGVRWTNVQHPRDYISRLNDGSSPVALDEDIPLQLEMGESMMMGLRLAEGVSDQRFRDRFHVGLESTYGSELTELCKVGLLQMESGTVRLTANGRLLGNQVFRRFLPD